MYGSGYGNTFKVYKEMFLYLFLLEFLLQGEELSDLHFNFSKAVRFRNDSTFPMNSDWDFLIWD